nr:reverse transcriptase domain-containing protein [Tanacetum cinerariifolium]
MTFSMDSAMKHSYSNNDTCFSIDVIDQILEEYFDALLDEWSKILHSIEGTILEEKLFAEFDEFMAMIVDENSEFESETEEPSFKELPPPTNVKGIRSFLGDAGIYRHFIKDFPKITRPLTKLLEKDTPFEFNDECHKAFNSLKEKLTCTHVIVSPNENLPFELMCDASDFAVGAVLGQKDDKKGTENIATSHLSRIDNDDTSDDGDVDDNYPGKTIMEITINDIP